MFNSLFKKDSNIAGQIPIDKPQITNNIQTQNNNDQIVLTLLFGILMFGIVICL